MKDNPLLRLHVAPTHDKKEILRKRMQRAYAKKMHPVQQRLLLFGAYKQTAVVTVYERVKMKRMPKKIEYPEKIKFVI
jgi:hypothetical protein